MQGYPKVKGYFVEHGIKQKDVAILLDMSVSTFNNKLNGTGDFTVQQVKKMCKDLNMRAEIFFTQDVPYKQQKIS